VPVVLSQFESIGFQCLLAVYWRTLATLSEPSPTELKSESSNNSYLSTDRSKPDAVREIAFVSACQTLQRVHLQANRIHCLSVTVT